MNTIDSVFKIIIVHEDSVTGLLGINLLKRVAAQLENRLGVNIDPWELCKRIWRFDWLRHPELWEEAVAKSAEADMIIISAEDHTELPACVRSWIESVLPRKRSGPAVLVALLDGPQIASMTTLPPALYLRQLADRYGVDFFCNLDDRPSHLESGIEAAFSHSPTATATTPADLQGETRGATTTGSSMTVNNVKLN